MDIYLDIYLQDAVHIAIAKKYIMSRLDFCLIKIL